MIRRDSVRQSEPIHRSRPFRQFILQINVCGFLVFWVVYFYWGRVVYFLGVMLFLSSPWTFCVFLRLRRTAEVEKGDVWCGYMSRFVLLCFCLRAEMVFTMFRN